MKIKYNASKDDALAIGFMHDNYKLLEDMFPQTSTKCPIWGCRRVVFINKAKIKMEYYIITQSSVFGYVYRTWNEVDDL